MKNVNNRIGFARLPIAAGAFASEPDRFQWSPFALSFMEGIVATREHIDDRRLTACADTGTVDVELTASR